MAEQNEASNVFPSERREFSFKEESQKIYKQTQEDLVFKKGKAVQSRVMSSPLFNATIENYGLDAAKTLILQELMNMSEQEIVEEVKVLARVAEENNDIKRSLRAAKILAIQWLEDEKRNDEMRKKCQFIIDTIPTFRINSANVIVKENKPEEKIPQPEPAKVSLPENKNIPLPPANPSLPNFKSVETIHKLMPGEKVLIITDIQGDYGRFRETLLKYDLIYYLKGDVVWNQEQKTKLVITGDLFNKSPYSSWGGRVIQRSFQVIDLFNRIVSQSEKDIHLCLGSYDLKISSNQIFADKAYGFFGLQGGISAQAQAIPAMISYLEATAFAVPESNYSLWERVIIEDQYYFKPKKELNFSEEIDLKIRADETLLPDISSIRDLLNLIYTELTLSPEKRPKSLPELEQRISGIFKEKEGENIRPLVSSENRSILFSGMIKITKTAELLKNTLVPKVTFETERKQRIKVAHVSLQDDVSKMFERIKLNNWKVDSDEDFLNQAKLLKIKKIEPLNFLRDLAKAGFSSLNDFLTTEAEDIYETLNRKQLLELFIPLISPNKIKFGYVKGIERFQKNIAIEDKSGLVGFEIIDRKQENDFSDSEMKKISDLNDSAKKAYSEKFLSDTFGSSSGFIIKIENKNQVICKKDRWKITIDIDSSAGLYEDSDKAIHVPIKHIALIEYQ